MPGAIPHTIAGFALFVVGRYCYKNYFDTEDKSKRLFLLLFICIFFSIIPDFLLIIYYTTYSFSFCAILPYHDLLHRILFVLAIFGLLVVIFLKDIKSKPIWIIGMLAIILHFTMDLFIQDANMWI